MSACLDFGVAAHQIFRFWDWVGGRYSLWGAIGLPVAIALGSSTFQQFLSGAAAMDTHFRTAPLARNLPVLLALVGIWRRNAMGWPTMALVPYDQRLESLPAYIQQLDMESNGKRVRRDGSAVSEVTGPVVWGGVGTNAQHSFFQYLHQGCDIIPVDFIVAAVPRTPLGDHHDLLLANCLAQGQALAFGRMDTAPHLASPGDRPSTTIIHRRLDAYTLGRLLALYEHKVFTQGLIWDINSFDQWGVELGKQLATHLSPLIAGAALPDDLDSSTRGLIRRLRELKET
jgi:glucose-6-phosphate isomerase